MLYLEANVYRTVFSINGLYTLLSMVGVNSQMGTLSVLIMDTDGTESVVWTRSRTTMTSWDRIVLELSGRNIFSVIIEGVVNNARGDIAIDDIEIDLCSNMSK